MSVASMRNVLKGAPKYKGAEGWKTKVDNMSDNQVIAVYYRMVKAGEL